MLGRREHNFFVGENIGGELSRNTPGLLCRECLARSPFALLNAQATPLCADFVQNPNIHETGKVATSSSGEFASKYTSEGIRWIPWRKAGKL